MLPATRAGYRLEEDQRQREPLSRKVIGLRDGARGAVKSRPAGRAPVFRSLEVKEAPDGDCQQ